MNDIRWGIIGCGNVTELKSGPAFNKVPHSSLVAVMRRDKQKVQDYAERHGVPKWYTDAQALINDPEINAVYIATPPDTHDVYTRAAIAAGKPVYVEKPMALHAGEALNMQRAAEVAGVKICVAHYRREQPYFKKIKALIDSKTIGDIQWVNLRLLQPHETKMIAQTEQPWRLNPVVSGGGLFHDLAPHQLDLMLYFFGPAQQAKGIALNKGGYYKADDTVTTIIEMENKVLFSGLWSFVAPKDTTDDSCEVMGSKGKIIFSVFGKQEISIEVKGEKEIIHFEAPYHVQQPMIEKVTQYFSGMTGVNPCPASAGVQVMQLIDTVTNKQKP